ncbi:MAG: hypothetical protein QOG72_2805 [Sphingomonadales bacterium]|jgi:hypothetical protein|nr:hypothetical protein [Sphingomonadales bacterium]
MAKLELAMAAALGLAGPAFASAPQGALSAEQAVESERAGVREAAGLAPCPRDRASGDIVVCGRRGPDPSRLRIPVERVPGEREHLLPGELPRAETAYDTCMFGCQHPVTVTDKQVRKYGGRILRHVLGKDD